MPQTFAAQHSAQYKVVSLGEPRLEKSGKTATTWVVRYIPEVQEKTILAASLMDRDGLTQVHIGKSYRCRLQRNAPFISLLSWTEVGLKRCRRSVRVKSESPRAVIYLLAAFRALTKFTRFRDLSSCEVRYG